MAGSIGPAVRRERRSLMVSHISGLIAGGALMALTLTLAGGLLDLAAARSHPVMRSVVFVVVIAVAFGWLSRLTFGWGLPYPRRRWQVPEHWRQSLPPLFTMSSYGFLLGIGFLTDVVLPSYWIMVGATLAVANAALALGAWLLYAGVRALITVEQSRAFSAAADERRDVADPPAINAPWRLAAARGSRVQCCWPPALAPGSSWPRRRPDNQILRGAKCRSARSTSRRPA